MSSQSILVATTTMLVTIIFIVTYPMIEAKNDNSIGFTIDLFHRDSSLSPVYDSSLTPSQRAMNTLKRSFNRIRRFQMKESTESITSDLTSYGGEYVMTYSVGTPPVPSIGVLDTGSSLIWTQCPPCDKCFKQKLPFFEPNKSSTNKPIPCGNSLCDSLSDIICDEDGPCVYAVNYGSALTSSDSIGNLSTDTFTFGSTMGKNVSIPNIAFGCGYINSGYWPAGESGVVGLGYSKASLISQLNTSIQGKFSYCLVPYLYNQTLKSGKLNFGDNALVTGEGVVSTPIYIKNYDIFYFLTLEGISVGDQRFQFFDSKGKFTEGNILIDSGAALTSLPKEFYDKIENAVKSRIKLKIIPDPAKFLNLCYLTKEQKIELDFPFTVHFKGGDFKLNSENLFFRTSDESLCFAFSTTSDVSVYGNLAQMNFLVGYDVNNKILAVKPTDCTKF